MSKLITVPDGLYEELAKTKGKAPFSKLLMEMLDTYKKTTDIRKFAGILKDKDVSSWLKDVKDGRKKGFKRVIKDI